VIDLSTTNLDHLGLVAAVCKDINLEKLVNNMIGSKDPRRVVGPGLATVAMILNGLGFTSRRLYLTPQFFANKPVELLLGKGLKAENFDDHALGRTLDEISAYGATRFFGEIAFEIAKNEGMLNGFARWDSTSFSVSGDKYEQDPFSITPTYGYSKDGRPELKQVMMGLVVAGSANLPIWMTALSGNASDNKVSRETIESVKRFQDEIKQNSMLCWTFDAAGFSADNVNRLRNDKWVTRVPEKITEIEKIITQDSNSFKWLDLEKGYKVAPGQMTYNGVSLRLVVVFSEQAYKKECITFESKITKEQEKLNKILTHLTKQIFACEKDAIKHFNKLQKEYEFFTLTYKLESTFKYVKKGRPTSGTKPEIAGYKIVVTNERNKEQIQHAISHKGRFVLAANNIDLETASDAQILFEYKEQQGVERGFKFLKDPWFMADTLFLKTPRRIEALMAIMTLCLLIYNLAQYRFRLKLQEQKELIPNQKNKPTQNPTLHWIFQLFEGITAVSFKVAIDSTTSVIIANLTELRKKIIRLFGYTACQIYGLSYIET